MKTIWPEVIAEERWCRFNLFEMIKSVIIFFESIKTVMEIIP